MKKNYDVPSINIAVFDDINCSAQPNASSWNQSDNRDDGDSISVYSE